MKTNKHTQGPWTLVRHMGYDSQGNGEQSRPENLMGFVGGNGERIMWFGDSETYYPTDGTEPNEANARLISSAPDLLEALIKSYKYISHMEKNLSIDGEHSELCLMIDAAISKATVKQPQ